MSGTVYQSKTKELQQEAAPKSGFILRKEIIYNALSRLVDLLASGLGLLLLSLLFLLIGMTIKRESPGPIFYRGKRAGKGGKPFWILKFRTMFEDQDSYNGPKVTAQDDPRVTPLGNWLRHTKLNELPQLWNVLKGEMGLVGPRPEDYDIAMAWPEEVRNEVLAVRPGITSPASVVYRDEESLLSQEGLMDSYLNQVLPTKQRIDLLYIRHRTILSDLDVIFWTFVALIPKIGKAQVPESLLLWGPLSHFFNRYVSWFLIDSLIAFCAVGLSEIIWRISEPLKLGWQTALLVGVGTAMAFSLCNMVFGLQNVSWRHAPAREMFKLAISTVLAITVAIGIDILDAPEELPKRMMLVAAALSFTGFVAARYRERLLTGLAASWIRFRQGEQTLGERVLVVGAGENGSLAAWLLHRKDFAQFYSIVGFVDDDPRKYALKVEGYPILGTTQDIPRLVKQMDIGLIVYTIDKILPKERRRIIRLCRQTQARVAMLPETIRFLQNQVGIHTGDEQTNSDASLNPDQQVLPVEQASLWLDGLEKVTQSKDWDGVQTQLRHIRSELQRMKTEK